MPFNNNQTTFTCTQSPVFDSYSKKYVYTIENVNPVIFLFTCSCINSNQHNHTLFYFSARGEFTSCSHVAKKENLLDESKNMLSLWWCLKVDVLSVCAALHAVGWRIDDAQSWLCAVDMQEAVVSWLRLIVQISLNTRPENAPKTGKTPAHVSIWKCYIAPRLLCM